MNTEHEIVESDAYIIWYPSGYYIYDYYIYLCNYINVKRMKLQILLAKALYNFCALMSF